MNKNKKQQGKIRNLSDIEFQILRERKVMVLTNVFVDAKMSFYLKNRESMTAEAQEIFNAILTKDFFLLGYRRQQDRQGYFSVLSSKLHCSLACLSGWRISEQEIFSDYIFNWHCISETKQKVKYTENLKNTNLSLQNILQQLITKIDKERQIVCLAFFPPFGGYPCIASDIKVFLCVIDKNDKSEKEWQSTIIEKPS